MEIKKEYTSLWVTKELSKKLSIWKYKLDCSSLDELIEKILAIATAYDKQMKKENKK